MRNWRGRRRRNRPAGERKSAQPRLIVPFGTAREELERLALADDKMQPFLQGKQVVKIIVVPDKLVNVVVKG